jgi:hypothetical protein
VNTPVLFDFSMQMHFQACMHVGVLRSIHVASHLTVSDTVEIKYSAAAAIFVIQTRRELTYLKRFSLLVLFAFFCSSWFMHLRILFHIY